MDPGFGQRQKNSRQQPELNQQFAIATEVIEILGDEDDDDIGAASETSGAAAVSTTSRPLFDNRNSTTSHTQCLSMPKTPPPNTSSSMRMEFARASVSECASGSAYQLRSASRFRSASSSALASTVIYDDKSYTTFLNGGSKVRKQTSVPAIKLDKKSSEICPYERYCTYGKDCVFQHNELCELCGTFSLHPLDNEERMKHIIECRKKNKKRMKISFTIAHSKDKKCGICFDVIMKKRKKEKAFGILSNCNHVFCLSCISKWRNFPIFENANACPTCRTQSDFVCPSPYWVETNKEKKKLINVYKFVMSKKHCEHFAMGKGKCPFGNKCFNKHALEDGQLVDVGSPEEIIFENSDNFTITLFDEVFGR